MPFVLPSTGEDESGADIGFTEPVEEEEDEIIPPPSSGEDESGSGAEILPSEPPAPEPSPPPSSGEDESGSGAEVLPGAPPGPPIIRPEPDQPEIPEFNEVVVAARSRVNSVPKRLNLQTGETTVRPGDRIRFVGQMVFGSISDRVRQVTTNQFGNDLYERAGYSNQQVVQGVLQRLGAGFPGDPAPNRTVTLSANGVSKQNSTNSQGQVRMFLSIPQSWAGSSKTVRMEGNGASDSVTIQVEGGGDFFQQAGNRLVGLLEPLPVELGIAVSNPNPQPGSIITINIGLTWAGLNTAAEQVINNAAPSGFPTVDLPTPSDLINHLNTRFGWAREAGVGGRIVQIQVGGFQTFEVTTNPNGQASVQFGVPEEIGPQDVQVTATAPRQESGRGSGPVLETQRAQAQTTIAIGDTGIPTPGDEDGFDFPDIPDVPDIPDFPDFPGGGDEDDTTPPPPPPGDEDGQDDQEDEEDGGGIGIGVIGLLGLLALSQSDEDEES